MYTNQLNNARAVRQNSEMDPCGKIGRRRRRRKRNVDSIMDTTTFRTAARSMWQAMIEMDKKHGIVRQHWSNDR